MMFPLHHLDILLVGRRRAKGLVPLGLRGKPPREMSVDDSGTETICMSFDLHLGDA